MRSGSEPCCLAIGSVCVLQMPTTVLFYVGPGTKLFLADEASGLWCDGFWFRTLEWCTVSSRYLRAEWIERIRRVPASARESTCRSLRAMKKNCF